MPSEILLINLQKKMSKEEIINQLLKINTGEAPATNQLDLILLLATFE